MTNDKDKIIIFDTTLRDGEQSPGATMSVEEKILIAKSLDKMGVDVIEAGFANSSRGDFEAISKISTILENSKVCSLARALKPDIEASAKAIKSAKKGRIHTFISTSDIHMKYKLKMEPEAVIEAIRDSVSYARQFCDDIEWSAEDATRTNRDFLFKAIEVAIDAGARTINIPDTVGYTIPFEYSDLITSIKNKVVNIDKAIISVHCHNDLGLAVANSLAAFKAGARQVESTVNGIGERAGNAAMEEVVMAIKTRDDILPFFTDIDSKMITHVSKLVSSITGFVVQNNKAIVGKNAFAHESGIHQDGMLKNCSTYEIMSPEIVGLDKSQLVLGKLSGGHALKKHLLEIGYDLSPDEFKGVFSRFKDLADKKKKIYDEDLISLVENTIFSTRTSSYEVTLLEVNSNSEKPVNVKIGIKDKEKTYSGESEGNGPVDALFKSIKQIMPHDATLSLYQVNAMTGGTDAIADVTVHLLNKDKRTISGNGRDTNTMIASAKAYISAIEKLQ